MVISKKVTTPYTFSKTSQSICLNLKREIRSFVMSTMNMRLKSENFKNQAKSSSTTSMSTCISQSVEVQTKKKM